MDKPRFRHIGNMTEDSMVGQPGNPTCFEQWAAAGIEYRITDPQATKIFTEAELRNMGIFGVEITLPDTL